MSVFTVVLGVLFLWQVLGVYFSGRAEGLTNPYTYEKVMVNAAGVLAAPFWIWICLIFVGLILWEIFYVPEKTKGLTDARYVLQRIEKRIPAEVGEELKESLEAVNREKKTVKILHICLCVLTALFVVYVIVYMCIPSNFPNVSKTSDMLRLCAFILPAAAVVLAAGCAFVAYYGYSAKRQLPYVKQLTKGIKEPQCKPGKIAAFVQNKNFILGIRIAVACLGVAFVIAGCLNGSVQEVLNKAIRICTECIGLG